MVQETVGVFVKMAIDEVSVENFELFLITVRCVVQEREAL